MVHVAVEESVGYYVLPCERAWGAYMMVISVGAKIDLLTFCCSWQGQGGEPSKTCSLYFAQRGVTGSLSALDGSDAQGSIKGCTARDCDGSQAGLSC